MNNAFTWLVLGALTLATGTRLWLAVRQSRHVRAHRNAVPESFADKIPLTAHQKAADYTIVKSELAMVDICLSAALVLALTFGGLLQRLSDVCSALAPVGSIAHGVMLIFLVVLLLSLFELPLTLYRSFVVEARFGFNRMTPRLFVIDLVKQALISAALGVPLLALVLWLMAKMGDLWWIWVWLAWTGFNLLVLLIYPSFIAPLFNKFSPLADQALAGRVESLLARCGFRSSGLYVMDGSKRSSHGNAYFTGFGAAKRIVFFDTLLERLAPGEIEAVLAHELGHFKHHHVWKRVLVLLAAWFVLLWVLGQLIGEPGFYNGLNVTTQSTATALLLFALVTPVFSFFLQPLSSLHSRKHEFEADAYAASHSNAAELVQALVKLYQNNAATLTPDPLHSAFYDSHPPATARIAKLSARLKTA
ncbi:MAG: M48 family peptidase [Betaproteobacteria bacterium]|nr:M48 family peptidase [Betaproteobacteria bacterium]